MKRIASTLALVIAASAPALAQEADKSVDEGFSLLEEGAKIILRSMLDEVEPSLKDMHEQFGEAMKEMAPALQDLAGMIGDIRNYHAPEMMPNGDIIIRRKSPAERALPKLGDEIEI